MYYIELKNALNIDIFQCFRYLASEYKMLPLLYLNINNSVYGF